MSAIRAVQEGRKWSEEISVHCNLLGHIHGPSWRHNIHLSSTSMPLCKGNQSVTGGFLSQRVTTHELHCVTDNSTIFLEIAPGNSKMIFASQVLCVGNTSWFPSQSFINLYHTFDRYQFPIKTATSTIKLCFPHTATSQERHVVSNHIRLDCLFNRFVRLMTKISSKVSMSWSMWWKPDGDWRIPFKKGQ